MKEGKQLNKVKEVTISRRTLKELCNACIELENKGWSPVAQYKKVTKVYDRRSASSWNVDSYEDTCYKIKMRKEADVV